ncbi:PHP domain-containing protein [Gudongella sp. DL1XJH-153]|uniref:PHP domain-containing protein n=1 Tax=Gudongella sp. DL1XJH-153 TaxID=3409804 RepID=UPI003BB74080
MYVLRGDYHTHTIYSRGYKKKGTHAKGTIQENVEAAYKKGLSTIVLSEHGPGHYLYGLREEDLPQIRNEIMRLREIYEPKGLKILLGLESNIIGLDGEIDIDEKIISQLDILLMGYHYGATPVGFTDAIGLYWTTQIGKLIGSKEEQAKDIMTEAYLKAMDKYPIDIITHPGSKAKVHIREIAKKAVQTNTALEISSKHDELSVESLQLIKDIPVDLYINSDAHEPGRVGDIEKGIKKALEADVDFSRIINVDWKE